MDEQPGDFYGQDLQHDARRGEIKPNLPQPLGFGDGCGDGGDQDQRCPHTADQRGHADQREQTGGAAAVEACWMVLSSPSRAAAKQQMSRPKSRIVVAVVTPFPK